MYKELIGETVIYGIGAILPRLILFVLNPILIHQMANSEFAIFTQLYAIISYINIVLSFGFETSYFRFSADRNNERRTFNTSFWFLFATSCIFLSICLFFSQPIADTLGYGRHTEYIRWFAMIAFFDNLCVIPFAWLRFHGMPIKYSAVRVVASIVQFVLTWLLFFQIPDSFSERFGLVQKTSYPFFSNLMASVLTFILLLPIIIKVRFQFVKDLFRKMLAYSWPIMIAGLAFMVNENFDKTIQPYFIPRSESGSYGGAYKLAVLMTLFVTAYRMGVEPFFFKQMNNDNAKQIYAKVTEYFTLFAVVMALGIIANLGWLKLILIPNRTYWGALDIIPIIVIANLFFGVYYNFSTWYKVTDRTRIGTAISWIGAVVNIGINLIALMVFQSMLGSAWATFAAYFVMMVISYTWGQKYYPIPYPIKKMGLSLLLCSALSLLIVKVFKYNIWISNALFLGFMTLILYNERAVLSLVLNRNNLRKLMLGGKK